MEILLKTASVNEQKLKRLTSKIVAFELTNLSEPCYYPELKKYYYELLHDCGLTEQDVKQFVKRFYVNHPAAKWALQSDPITNFYIFMMHYFILNKDYATYNIIMVLHTLRNYSNRMHLHFKYCNKDVFRYTLEHIAKTHLFSREKTIPNALYFLSGELSKKYKDIIKIATVDGISKFITESRHRVAQSLKSFAELYYKCEKEGLAYKQPIEDEEGREISKETSMKGVKIIDDTIKKIVIYKKEDVKAKEIARKLTKVNSKLADQIVHTMMDIKYSDNIKIICELFIKDITNVKNLCGSNFFKYVKRLMAIKKTNQKIYFKQQINVLVVKIIDELDYTEKYKSLSSQSQFLINLFTSLYITLVLRHLVCGTKELNMQYIRTFWKW